MKIFRFSALLAAGLTLVSCGGTLGRTFESLGRTLHLNSETTKSPGDFKLESSDARAALADGAKVDVKRQGVQPGLALR